MFVSSEKKNPKSRLTIKNKNNPKLTIIKREVSTC